MSVAERAAERADTRRATLDRAIRLLQAGETVYIQTYGHAWKISPKAWAGSVALGRPLLVMSGGSVYLQLARRRECIDWAAITSGGRYV